MITLRDFFAATALQGALAGGTEETRFHQDIIDDYANLAYAFADAMLLRSHNAPRQPRESE